MEDLYITTEELEAFLGIEIAEDAEDIVALMTEAVQEYIEDTTGTTFLAEDDETDETRLYDGSGATKLTIDPLRAITSLTVDGVGLVVNDDYLLYPLNALSKGDLVTQIQLLQPETRLSRSSRIENTSPYVFEKAQANVQVVGRFGYEETPALIKMVTLKMVSAMIKESAGVGGDTVKEITSESLGDYSVSFSKITEIADRVGAKDLLSKYIFVFPQGSAKGTIIQVS